MKREIKYRGKSIYDKEWLYGSLVKIEEDRYTIIPDLNDIEIGKAISMYEVHPETVGQYSEVKDKDGVEVYEGDIVEWVDSDEEYRFDIVAWMYGGLCLCNNQYMIGSYYGLKVKGNKYDNPELLKLISRC